MSDFWILLAKILFPPFGFFDSVKVGIKIDWRHKGQLHYEPLPPIQISMVQALLPQPRAMVRHALYTCFERTFLHNKYNTFSDVDKSVHNVHIEAYLQNELKWAGVRIGEMVDVRVLQGTPQKWDTVYQREVRCT